MQLQDILRTIILATSSMLVAASPLAASRAATAPQPGVRAVPGAPQPRTQPANPDYSAVLIGAFAAQVGDDDRAATAYQKALARDPDNKALARDAFLYSVMSGSPESARLARYQEAGNPLVEFTLGNHEARSNNWAKAREHFRKIPRDPLIDLMRPVLLAWCYQGEGQTEKAIGLLKSSISGTPFDSIYALHAGMIAQSAGHNDEAGQFFQKAYDQISGSDIRLGRVYGSWLLQNGKLQEGEALLRHVIESVPALAIVREPLMKEIKKPVKTTPYEGIGHIYEVMASLIHQQMAQIDLTTRGRKRHVMRTGSMKTERLMLRFALDMDPGLTSARLMMAGLKFDEGYARQVRHILLEVKPSDPMFDLVQVRLAELEAGQGNNARAQEILEKLLACRPGQPILLQSLGDILIEEKQYARAIDAYSQAVETLTRDKKMPNWALLMARAVAYDRAGSWEKAEADLRKALLLNPNEPIILNYLAYSWVLRGRNYEEARIMLTRALASDPGNAAIRDSLGWLFVREGDLKEGVEQLEKAAEKIPSDPEVNYHLGVVYSMTGRMREAFDQLHVALAANPDEKLKEKILSDLEKLKKEQALAP